MHVYQIGGRRVEGAGESAARGSGERSPEGGHGRPRIIFSTSERLFWGCLGAFSECDMVVVRPRGVSWVRNECSHEFERGEASP